MGLVYSPTESEGLVNALRSNITTAQGMIDDMNSASRHLVDAINGRTLSGEAYEAGKGLFKELVIPTISKASETLEQLKSKLSQYEGYAGAAGGELLDEDKLNRQLELLRAQQASLTSQINFYRMQSYNHIGDPELNMMYANFQSQLSSYMSTTADDIQKVQDKLKRLHEFNSNVNGMFSDIKKGIDIIVASTKVLGGIAFNDNGSFSMSKTIENSGYVTDLITAGIIKNKGNKLLAGIKVRDEIGKGGLKTGRVKWGKKYIIKGDGTASKTGKKLFSAIEYDAANYKNVRTSVKSELKSMLDVKDVAKGWTGAEKASGIARVGKVFRVAGWVGTAVDAGSSVNELRSKGFSKEQTATITARRTVVNVASSATGQTVGRVGGAMLGAAVGGPIGAAVGSVVGGVIGGFVGSLIGNAVNDNFDKGVKPKKKGWSWPW